MAAAPGSTFDPAAWDAMFAEGSGLPPGLLARLGVLPQLGGGAPAPNTGLPPALVSQLGGLPQPAAAASVPPPMDITPPGASGDELPAAAAPVSGPIPSGVAAPPPSPAVPETSLFGRLGNAFERFADFAHKNPQTFLALGAGLAGAPSWGTGISRGLSNVGPAMALDIKQNQVNSTVVALMKKMPGLSQEEATAIAANPGMLAQVLPQLFGAKQRKFSQIGEDMMGNKKFGFVDEVANKVYDLAGNEITGAPGSPGQAAAGMGGTVPVSPTTGQPMQGQELLQHLERVDPASAAGIKSLIEGTGNPNARNLQRLAPVAALVDPSFDATQYPVRLATRKSYTSGKDFQETQALNTVSGHMGKLMEAANELGNWNSPIANTVRNWFSDTFTGNPQLTRFRNALVTTSNELAKAYHGGHVSDAAYAAFNKSVNDAQTPADMRAAIGELAALLQSKIEAKESGYRASMGAAPLPSEFKAINDEAAHSFQKIRDWANPVGAAAPKAPTASSAAPAAAVPSGSLPPGFREVPVR